MRTLLIFISIALGCLTYAQQDIQLTNFESGEAIFNPATISNTKFICGNIAGRNQWSQFGGNPNTALINIYGKLDNHNFVGFQILTDAIGFQNSNFIKLSYAYKFYLQKTSISIGLNANVFHSKWGGNFITPDTPQSLDDAIPDNTFSATKFDMDAGIYIKNGPLYMGLSTSHLNQSNFSQPGIIGFQSKRHYFIHAGWEERRSWGSIEPKILAKSDVASTQLDFQIQSQLNYKYIVGLNYRISDAISPMIGVNLTNGIGSFKFIYAYDITTSKLRNYSKGTHELTLNICFSKTINRERYTNPRNLGNYDFGPRGKW